MDYSADSAQAQEIARLVFPTMTRLNIPLDPVNYALWYEYYLGRSSQLNAALDQIESGREPYDADKARLLFMRYVATPGVSTQAKVEFEMRRLLADIVQVVADAGLNLANYGAVLGSCSSRLENVDDLRDVRRLVRTLLHDTQEMTASSRGAAGTLKACADEIDQLRAELDKMREEAIKDPLTGLANRRAFDESLSEALDDTLQNLKNICLVMIDVDHFKEINDKHGHQIGDKVLQFVAAVLKKNFKGKDLVARYGGDEFAVIVENAPRAGVMRVAETIRTQVEESSLKRTDTGEPLGRITVSVGYDCMRADDTPNTVMDRADKALYEAKKHGRNQVMPHKG